MQAREFVARLLVVDVTARMTMAQSLTHPWLAAAAARGAEEAVAAAAAAPVPFRVR